MLAIQDYKDIHAGQAAWIVGNGPSLNRMELGFLDDEISFCLNRIYLGEERFGFTPTYFTVEDHFVAEDTPDEINALTYTKFLPEDLSYCLSGGENVCWVNFVRNYEGYPRFSDDAASIIYWGSTVTYLAIQLAYYMGADPIYLIGVDFDYTIPYYAEGMNILSREDDVNHFDPRYFGKGKRWHHPRLDLVEPAYVEARRFIESRGRRIYNAGVGGKLEVFERVDYRAAARGHAAGPSREAATS